MLTPKVIPHLDRDGSPVVPARSSSRLPDANGMTSADARDMLERLLAERSSALVTDLEDEGIYMDDLRRCP